MKRNVCLDVKGFKRNRLLTYIKQTRELVGDGRFKDRSRKNARCFTRTRKMPFEQVVLHILTAQKTSMQTALENFFEKMGDIIFMTKQAFSEARHNLNVCAYVELFIMTVKLAYQGYYETRHGYRLTAIDGTGIHLPTDKKLAEHYGTSGSRKDVTTARGSILYDVLNKVVIDAQISPYSCDERTLAVNHLDALEQVGKLEKELVILDRGYPSVQLIQEFQKHNVRFLMRVKRTFNLGIDMQTKVDGSVRLYDKTGKYVKVRVVKFELPSGEIESLITDIWDKRMGIKAFKELYLKRWDIEQKYDEVKNKLEIENFTGRSVQAIEQDFYATMYLSNVASAACWEAQSLADEQRESKDNKYDYHINVNHAVGVLKTRFIKALLETNDDKRSRMIERVLFLLAKSVSEVRPN